MFQHKTTVGIAELTNADVDTLSSRGSNLTLKNKMDPAKDSWVFTKDVPQKYHTSKKHKHALDNISYSIREESCSPSLTDEEVMKLNALYNGGVYRVKGFRIICSVLTGIVLLLTALVILGVWIILGAKENGEMYFPWNEIENNTIHSVKNEKSKLGGFLLDINYDVPASRERDMLYDMTSHEVVEAIGHFQGLNPKPLSNFDRAMTSAEYDQYNMDYEEYYNDLLEEYSLLHPTVVEPPAGFIEDLYEYYEDVNNREEFASEATNIVATRIKAPVKSNPEQANLAPNKQVTEDKTETDRTVATKTHSSSKHSPVQNSDTSTSPSTSSAKEDSQADLEVVEYDGVLIDEDFKTPTSNVQAPHSEVIELTLTKDDLEPRQSNRKPMIKSRIEEDPHWDLFTKKYTSDEIILDHLFRKRFRQRNLRLPQTEEQINPRESVNGEEQEKQKKSSRAFSPIPSVRRSQIASGVLRPRLNSAQLEYLQTKRRRNTQPTAVFENSPRFQIDRRDGPIIQNFRGSPIVGSPIQPTHNNFQPWRRSSVSKPLINSISNANRQNLNLRVSPETYMRSPYAHSPPTLRRKPVRSNVHEGGFVKALTNMYEYSKNIATALMKFPDKNDATNTRTSVDFLKNSFGLLYDYDHVFSNLPQVFMEPLIKFKLPSTDQLDDLNPFQISLITWTFIDFWEFLIEKVGTLSKEDLRTLELRLAKIRQTKDSRIARALIDAEANYTSSADDSKRLREYERSLNFDSQNNSSVDTGRGIDDNLVEEDKAKFMKYSVKTLLNFGRVYMETDYALDCIMLLFCKDMNANTEREGMDGVAAKLKSVGLKVLVDREGRERDTISSVWQALFEWQPLECEAMFPKCDASRALEIVNEVASAAR